MFVEATVFGGDERVPHVLRDDADRHVDAAHVREVTDELLVAVVDVSALARMEGANLGRRRAAVEAAGAEPGVERDDADAGEREQAEPRPLASQPVATRDPPGCDAAAARRTASAVANERDGHAVAVVSMLIDWYGSVA